MQGKPVRKNLRHLARCLDTLYNQHVLKLNYIQLPLLLTYKIPLSRSGNRSFFISAGPYVSFIMTAIEPYQNRVKAFNSDKYIYTSDKEDLPVGNGQGKYKTTDFGVDVKAGFEIGRIMLSGYFSRGLSNAYQAAYPASFHHQLAGATLGIWLSGSKPSKPRIKNHDSDRDGIFDALDSCPAVFGWKRYHDARFRTAMVTRSMMKWIPAERWPDRHPVTVAPCRTPTGME